MNIKFKLSQIPQLISGELIGEDVEINQFATSVEKATEQDLVFIYNPKYLNKISEIKAKAMILPMSYKESTKTSIPVVFVQRPRLVLKTLLTFLHKSKYKTNGIHETACIDKSSSYGNNCSIGAYVYIGPNTKLGDNCTIKSHTYIGANVLIGNNTEINSNCSILDFTQIKNNVTIHPGCVIGSDGFGYVTEEESNLEKIKKGANPNLNIDRQVQHKIPTCGNVVIGNDVEIGANSTIDGGTIGSTEIQDGTKIDNLVLVAHNVKIGKDCLIVGGTVIGGSTVLGNRVVAGGHCSFADNITVGNDVVFVARSAIHGNIESNSVYIGMPAIPYMDYIRNEKFQRRLPRKQEKLEEQMKNLEERLLKLENFSCKI